jgi:hypothetical protein
MPLGLVTAADHPAQFGINKPTLANLCGIRTIALVCRHKEIGALNENALSGVPLSDDADPAARRSQSTSDFRSRSRLDR